MTKKTIYLTLLLCPLIASGQHTFSIVAVDTVTGMAGSAGASCLDTVNSYNINRINATVPGRGSICAQAQWDFTNLDNAKSRMIAGDSPDEILAWLMDNDSQNNPQRMQYGIADLDDNNHARATAFSGSQATSYKGHIIGSNYAVQGNILIGKQTIDSIELGFLNTTGTFTDKLMGAIEGAAFPGADKRCLDEGVSCRSAYIRAARPTDPSNDLYLDLYVGATPYGVEPIHELRKKYDDWNATKNIVKDYQQKALDAMISHNQKNGVVILKFNTIKPDKLELINFSGKILSVQRCDQLQTIKLDLSRYSNGFYFINYYRNETRIGTHKISLIK